MKQINKTRLSERVMIIMGPKIHRHYSKMLVSIMWEQMHLHDVRIPPKTSSWVRDGVAGVGCGVEVATRVMCSRTIKFCRPEDQRPALHALRLEMSADSARC